MAQITKSVHAEHGMAAHLIPPATLAKLSQDELADRLAHMAKLTAKAARATNRVVAECYEHVAKATLTAMPPAELAQQVRDKRAKAALLGPVLGDALLRQADELEARNPVPPRRTAVRKAQDAPVLVPMYDCNGKLTGVVDEAEVIPVTDAALVAKAARTGMVTAHDDQGKLTGVVPPAAVRPPSNVTVNLGGTTGLGLPRNAPQQRLPGDVPGRQVIKGGRRTS